MSPDGRWVIADVRDTKAGRLLMHLVDVATGEDTLLLDIGRPERFADGTTNATHGHPVWHPDGSSVIFNAQPGDNSQVFLMRV